MKLNRLMSASLAATALLWSACTDDKYDLSDIDTTTRVSVNDLVVPINIDQIQLKSIININESDPNAHIKVIDGVYTYVQSGDFSTGAIKVNPVTIKAAKTSKIAVSLPITIPGGITGTIPGDYSVSVPIPAQEADYDFNAQNVTSDICDIDKIEGSCTVNVAVRVNGLTTAGTTYEFANLRLKLPAGMSVSDCEGCVYDANTHSLTINQSVTKPEVAIKCVATGIAFAKGQFDEASHSISVSGKVGIVDGTLKLNAKNPKVEDLTSLALTVDYSFSDINVTSIDGILQYTINDVNVPVINISGIPDVLNQPGTNLVLANPCLYLGVRNPLYVCGAYAQTGFEITSYHGEQSAKYSIDKPYFDIAANERDNFCFSPKMPSNPDAAFGNCQHVAFTSLSKVLSGDGLPDKLKVDLVDPTVPRQSLKGFKLGYDYGKVQGDYKFVAPLQFDGGTAITYTDRLDGWHSDDLEKMTVTRLEVNFTVSTDIPVAVDFTGHPLDKNGNRISGVQIEGAQVDANAKDQKVKISVTGTITNLDGLEFVAKAAAQSGGAALSPNMTIKLSDIRPCVSGYYQTEL